MCEKCEDADRKIAHYMLLSRSVMDQAAFHRIAEIIAEIRADKAAGHSDSQPLISPVSLSEPTAD